MTTSVKKLQTNNLACRIALDIALILVSVTLFSKNVISLMYHEAVGLVLCALFVLHVILNRRWIVNLFRRKIGKGARPKAMAIVNVLLVLSWLAVMVTGILVSKKIFAIQISSLNPVHFFSAAVALIMTGVHFGLHWQYFWGFLGKHIHFPRVIALILSVIVILFGCWQTVNSSFPRWISAPFTASSGEHGVTSPSSEAAMTASDATVSKTENSGDRSGNSETTDVSAASGKSQYAGQPFSFVNLMNVIATYFSMIFLFAAVTRGIELLTKKFRTR